MKYEICLRLIKSIRISLLGVGIVLVGFVYDLLLAGIPYQDPTLEMQTSYDFHSSVAETFYKIGGIIFWIGVMAIPFIWKIAQKKKDCQQIASEKVDISP